MSGRKNAAIVVGFMLSASLITAALMTVFLNFYYSRAHFQVLGEICQEIVEKEPDAELAVLSALKEYKRVLAGQEEESIIHGDSVHENIIHESILRDDIMKEYGYRQADFWKVGEKTSRFFVVAGILGGGLLFLFSFLIKRKKEISRIDALTDYLENSSSPACKSVPPLPVFTFSR